MVSARSTQKAPPWMLRMTGSGPTVSRPVDEQTHGSGAVGTGGEPLGDVDAPSVVVGDGEGRDRIRPVAGGMGISSSARLTDGEG